jgi:hypothetical protein
MSRARLALVLASVASALILGWVAYLTLTAVVDLLLTGEPPR